MLLKNNQQKATYWGRVLALPLVLLIAVFFSFKANAEKDITTKHSQNVNAEVILDTVPGRKDIKNVTIRPSQEKAPVLVEWSNGKKESMSVAEAEKQGIPLPPPPPPAPPVPGTGSKYDNVNVYMPKGEDAYITFTGDNGKKESISLTEAKKLGVLVASLPSSITDDPNSFVFSAIENGELRTVVVKDGTTEVLTPEEAKKKGIKAPPTVLRIFQDPVITLSKSVNYESPKGHLEDRDKTVGFTSEGAKKKELSNSDRGIVLRQHSINVNESSPDKDEKVVVVNGRKKINYAVIVDSTSAKSSQSHTPLFILDGKEITSDEMNNLSPNKIESISVLKDENAVSIYGEKGRNGVVIIELKK